MSKSTKKKVTLLDPSNFLLTCTVNPDLSVQVNWSLVEPPPIGMIFKWAKLAKFDASGIWIGGPWGLGPDQDQDITTLIDWTNEYLDTGAVGATPGTVGTIQYVLYTYYGIPGDPTSSLPGGSNIVPVSL